MTALPSVVFVIEAAGGGAGKHLLDLARGLRARGHEVAVIYSPVRAEVGFLEGLAALGCQMHAVRMSLAPWGWRDWLALRRVLSLYPGSWVHSHASRAGCLARVMSWGLRMAGHAYTPHGWASMNPMHAPWKRWLYGCMEQWLAGWTRWVVCVSQEERRHALHLGVRPDCLVVIPNGIEPVAWLPREAARRRLGCQDSGMIALGWIGRFVQEKGLRHLMEVVSSLPLSIPWHVFLVGDGPLKDEIAAICKDKGLSDRVTLVGVEKASRVMKAWDIFVFPSMSEAAPYAILEAMDAGLAIVGSDVGDIGLMLGDAGVLLPRGDTALWRAALVDLLERPQKRARLGEAASQRVRQFSLDAMIVAHEALFSLDDEPKKDKV